MSFPRYPKYKDSGVEWLGDVPEHWTIRRLGYHFIERREKVSDKDFAALSVTKNGVVPQLETAAKTDDGDNRKLVRRGDFVINSRSDRKGSAGIATFDGSVSLINTVLQPHATVWPQFAHHLLRSQLFQEEFYRNGKGIVADLWSTNYSEMRNIVLALPDAAEQRQIGFYVVAETSKIDALIAEQRRLIELLKEKHQAVISQVVTKGLTSDVPMKASGVEWIGDVPAHWAIPPMYSRYDSQLGKMLDTAKLTHRFLVPYLRNADVNWDSVNVSDLPTIDIEPEELERYTLQFGDVLICEGGAGVGQTAIWQGQLSVCAFQKALHRVRPRSQNENPRYLYYCMHLVVESGAVLTTGNTSTIPHFTGEKLRGLRLPCPPRHEQDAIVGFLNEMSADARTLIEEAESAMDILEERRTALISAAVTGKIDVRNLVDADAA